MGQYLNWVTLVGVALIVGGIGLLALAVGAAKTLAPARHRRGTGRDRQPLSPRRGGPYGEVRQPGVYQPGVASTLVRQPEIRRSVLLADTIRLNEVPPPGQPR